MEQAGYDPRGDVAEPPSWLTPIGRTERFGIGPVPAIRRALKSAGLTLDQMETLWQAVKKRAG